VRQSMLVGEHARRQGSPCRKPFRGNRRGGMSRRATGSAVCPVEVYVNSTHEAFKFLARGKAACNQTQYIRSSFRLRRELARSPYLWGQSVPPRAQGVFGKITPLTRTADAHRSRRRYSRLVTASVLLLPASRCRRQAAEYSRFVEDLKIAADLCENARTWRS